MLGRRELSVVEGLDLPLEPSIDTVYRLLPKNFSSAFYAERVDRNIGWITRAEQEMLRTSVVGIAGCGGMGGQIASLFTRLGIGEVRIADCEAFDASNINRQFGAMRSTIGFSKAFTTARMTREVCDDVTLVVYPQGITEETVGHFLKGCDVILDEIEVLALDARILLHQEARHLGLSLFNCNTVGFSTNLFLYTPESITMEEMTGLNYEQAKSARQRAQTGDTCAGIDIARRIMKAVVPHFPDYSPGHPEVGEEALLRRLYEEGKASIIATNPTMAAGFLADRVLLYLLRNSGVSRQVMATPTMPGYLHFDAARMEMRIHKGEW